MTDRSDKTKESIKHALIALMEREPFEVITVKQIVAKSGVGRHSCSQSRTTEPHAPCADRQPYACGVL